MAASDCSAVYSEPGAGGAAISAPMIEKRRRASDRASGDRQVRSRQVSRGCHTGGAACWSQGYEASPCLATGRLCGCSAALAHRDHAGCPWRTVTGLRKTSKRISASCARPAKRSTRLAGNNATDSGGITSAHAEHHSGVNGNCSRHHVRHRPSVRRSTPRSSRAAAAARPARAGRLQHHRQPQIHPPAQEAHRHRRRAPTAHRAAKAQA